MSEKNQDIQKIEDKGSEETEDMEISNVKPEQNQQSENIAKTDDAQNLNEDIQKSEDNGKLSKKIDGTVEIEKFDEIEKTEKNENVERQSEGNKKSVRFERNTKCVNIFRLKNIFMPVENVQKPENESQKSEKKIGFGFSEIIEKVVENCVKVREQTTDKTDDIQEQSEIFDGSRAVEMFEKNEEIQEQSEINDGIEEIENSVDSVRFEATEESKIMESSKEIEQSDEVAKEIQKEIENVNDSDKIEISETIEKSVDEIHGSDEIQQSDENKDIEETEEIEGFKEIVENMNRYRIDQTQLLIEELEKSIAFAELQEIDPLEEVLEWKKIPELKKQSEPIENDEAKLSEVVEHSEDVKKPEKLNELQERSDRIVSDFVADIPRALPFARTEETIRTVHTRPLRKHLQPKPTSHATTNELVIEDRLQDICENMNINMSSIAITTYLLLMLVVFAVWFFMYHTISVRP